VIARDGVLAETAAEAPRAGFIEGRELQRAFLQSDVSEILGDGHDQKPMML
jgi:hypothetical protein